MSSTNICSDLYSDPALALVGDAYALFKGYSETALDRALQQIDLINDFEQEFVTWDGTFDATGELSGFIRPSVPTLPTLNPTDLTDQVPAVPSLGLTPLVADTPPAEPAELSNLPSLDVTYTTPVLEADAPGAAPELEFDDAPAPLTLDTVTAPTLVEIEIPDAPTVEVTMFAEEAPEFDAAVPGEAILFTEQAYSSDLATLVSTQLAEIAQGNFVLPAAVASALWGRAIERDDEASAKARQQAWEQFSSRGFEEPDGILNARLQDTERDNRAARGNLNRDLYIQDEEKKIAQLQWAVQTSMTWESTLMQAHLAVQERAFQLAVKAKDVAIAVFNAQVARYNGLIAAYNARVEAYKAFLDGLRASVDLYRAQVEAAKVRGEINEQNVRVYAEQIRAQAARADLYRAQIEGFKASIDAQRTRMDAYRVGVEAYTAQVQAYGEQWRAVKTQIEAAVARGQLYGSLVEFHGQRVATWSKQQDVKIAAHNANLSTADTLLKQHESGVRVILARMQSLRDYLAGQVAQGEQLTRLFEAQARVEGTAVDADTRVFNAETERARQRTAAADRNAELQITQFNNLGSLQLRALESAGQASAQVASATFAAINMSAGVSSSQSRSKSCNTSFTYSGEPADAGA